jgi:hypothetical protein
MNRVEIEHELGLELPNNFDNYDEQTQKMIINYLNHLDIIERKAYSIGRTHLGSSFNIIKSNGFVEWKKKQTS